MPTKNTFTITSEAMASSVWPGSGSTFGGQMVNITGNGFSGADTSVDADGSPCEVSLEDIFDGVSSLLNLFVSYMKVEHLPTWFRYISKVLLMLVSL